MTSSEALYPGMAFEFRVDSDGLCWPVPVAGSQPGGVQRSNGRRGSTDPDATRSGTTRPGSAGPGNGHGEPPRIRNGASEFAEPGGFWLG